MSIMFSKDELTAIIYALGTWSEATDFEAYGDFTESDCLRLVERLLAYAEKLDIDISIFQCEHWSIFQK